MNEEVVLLFVYSMKKSEKGVRDEADRIRMIRISISYQTERFSRIDTFDG